jgi:tetratricopeptide (TPR) repeat protein
MKRVASILFVLVMITGLALAQSNAQGQNAPAKQASGAQASAAPAPAPPVGKTPPAAKTQAEMDEYTKVATLAQQGNAAGAEQAADVFAEMFKSSDLRYLVYYQVMMSYQQQNNADKAIELGHKVLALNPTEPATLAMVASYISERTRSSDLDADERLNEAMQDAQKCLQYVDTELVLPPGTTQAVADVDKALLRSIAYGAIGNSYLIKSDYANAEANLKKSVEIAPPPGDAVNWLRYAVVLDVQNKFKDAMTAVDRAIELAPAGSAQAKMAQDERTRILQRAGTTISKPASSSAPAPTK